MSKISRFQAAFSGKSTETADLRKNQIITKLESDKADAEFQRANLNGQMDAALRKLATCNSAEIPAQLQSVSDLLQEMEDVKERLALNTKIRALLDEEVEVAD